MFGFAEQQQQQQESTASIFETMREKVSGAADAIKQSLIGATDTAEEKYGLFCYHCYSFVLSINSNKRCCLQSFTFMKIRIKAQKTEKG